MHVLCKWSLRLSIVERVSLISEEVKGYGGKNLKTMGKSINPALHAWVVIERVVVKVAKLRGISL